MNIKVAAFTVSEKSINTYIFFRLTPPYMLFLMFYVCLMKYWSDGPMWPQGLDVDDCRDSWWRNLLYVNNLVEPKQMVRFGS